MTYPADTIVAAATPPGTGGVGIVRISEKISIIWFRQVMMAGLASVVCRVSVATRRTTMKSASWMRISTERFLSLQNHGPSRNSTRFAL